MAPQILSRPCPLAITCINCSHAHQSEAPAAGNGSGNGVKAPASANPTPDMGGEVLVEGRPAEPIAVPSVVVPPVDTPEVAEKVVATEMGLAASQDALKAIAQVCLFFIYFFFFFTF